MIDSYERSRLCHSVALHNRKSKSPPERLGVGGQRRSTGYERPKLPAELTMNPAKRPPSHKEVLTLCPGEFVLKRLVFTTRFRVSFDLVPQRVEHARHDCCSRA